MKNLKFLLAGIFFGIIMFKSEAASWYRIQEMFRFQDFHMYGIIGLAVGLGVPMVWWIKKESSERFLWYTYYSNLRHGAFGATSLVEPSSA